MYGVPAINSRLSMAWKAVPYIQSNPIVVLFGIEGSCYSLLVQSTVVGVWGRGVTF